MSIGSKGIVTCELFSAVTIGLSFQTQIGEISVKGIRATSVYERQGGKITLQLAWLAGKEFVTVTQYQEWNSCYKLDCATGSPVKNSHTCSESLVRRSITRPSTRHIFPAVFGEKNRKYPTNFICGSFQQSTEPVVKSFLKLFVILFREMIIINCILDLMSRLIRFIKFSLLAPFLEALSSLLLT